MIEVVGDAWRYLAWLRPLPNALPERLPPESFGAVPFQREAARPGRYRRRATVLGLEFGRNTAMLSKTARTAASTDKSSEKQ